VTRRTIGWLWSTSLSCSIAFLIRNDHSTFERSASSRSWRSVMSIAMPQTP
jgi:hypothetical protein